MPFEEVGELIRKSHWQWSHHFRQPLVAPGKLTSDKEDPAPLRGTLEKVANDLDLRQASPVTVDSWASLGDGKLR